MTVIGESVILYGLDSNGNPVALKLNADGTLSGGGSGSTSPLTTKGDLWGFDTQDTRVPIGATDGHLLTIDSAQALGLKWAYPSITNGTAAPAGDVNITPNNTNIDIATVSLPAGTYLLIGSIYGVKATTGSLFVMLWDNVTGYTSSQVSIANGNAGGTTVCAIVTLAVVTTVRLTGRVDAGTLNAFGVLALPAAGSPISRLRYFRIG